ncbi:hypothetical protein [Streptomyces sp. Ag109_O5-1]|uniref:hypothetical protein n=1 Tax=Streptomyces sp. Ag109_O5-1 TaxID=1938851 RepID=UPI00162A58CE|nr:hypothetical protein [Streptomyces sp. Ag109_O5-1]
MRELEAQDDHGGDHPVGENQLVARARAGGALPFMASAFAQAGLLSGDPRGGELGDQLAQEAAWEAGADAMAQGRAGPS